MRASLVLLLLLAGCSAGGDYASKAGPEPSGAPQMAGKPADEATGSDGKAPPQTQAADVRQKIIELSTRERVLSDYTALLVLESEADYQRFHLDRRSLADIMFIDPATWMVGVSNARGQEPYDPANLEAESVLVKPFQRSLAPVSLTSAEGVGLHLKRLRAGTVIQGPLAFTELHLSFQNPENRTLEGRFELSLPEGAAISRLAMHNGRQWLEGEVVELQAARAAYEDSLHRRQDPALMEKQTGNRFQARIFPIAPKEQKDLVVSYSQELTSHQDYRLPLAGLPVVDELEVTALVSEDPRHDPYRLRMRQEGKAPPATLCCSAGVRWPD